MWPPPPPPKRPDPYSGMSLIPECTQGPRLHAWHSHRQSRSQQRFHHSIRSMRYMNKFHFFSFFRNSFFCHYYFSYHGDQKISWWRICRWLAVNFEIHLVVPSWTLTSENASFGVCESRRSHQLTSDPNRCLLFWKYLQWSCLKAVSVPAFVIGGVWSSTATSTLVGESIKGEVRTINDRKICERRSCMKNNGKSPTFEFVSGEERRPSEVRRVSRGLRLPGATYSSADPTWIRKWLEIQAPELSELESVELELGSCCSDLDKQVLHEICRPRKRQFEIPFRLLAASCPRVTSCSIPPCRLSRKRRRTDQKDFYHVPQHHKPQHIREIHFLPNFP